jgi:hypothetical protein
MTEMYSRTLCKACDRVTEEGKYEQNRALSFVITAREPLTIYKFDHVFEQLPAADKAAEKILEYCGSFVKIMGKITTFIHYSAKGFLTKAATKEPKITEPEAEFVDRPFLPELSLPEYFRSACRH